MNVNEALLFQHINIVIKLLNSFIDKNNITSIRIHHRLDYLYERLSDFLGRELDNGWWSEDRQKESQSTNCQLQQSSIIQKIPKYLLRAEPVNLQPSQYVKTVKSSTLIPSNFESLENARSTTSSSIQSVPSEPPQNSEIAETPLSSNEQLGATNSDIQKNGKITVSSHSSKVEPVNCVFLEDVKVAEIKPYSSEPKSIESSGTDQIAENGISVLPVESHEDNPTDGGYRPKCGECNKELTLFNCNYESSMSLHVQSTVHQQAMKQKTEKSGVDREAKGHVTEKARTDIGKYVIEKVTTLYLCTVCDLTIDNVRSHVSSSSHQENMRERKGIMTVETENTESICEKKVSMYYCQLCSMNTSGVQNMEEHLTGRCHLRLSAAVSDPHIKINKRKVWCCTLCSVRFRKTQDIHNHLQGKPHQKNLKAQSEDKESLQSVEKDENFEVQLIDLDNDKYCSESGVFALEDHICSENS